MHQRGDREKAPRTEGVNQRRKRLLQNTPKARVGRAAERPSGLGGLGRPAGQGRRSGRAGWAGKEKKRKKGNPLKLNSRFRKMNKEIRVTEIIGKNPKNSQKIVENLGRQECELE
jgi:hypothetical protein